MALDTTIGGASANSYVDLPEAATYFSGTVRAETWATFEDPQKEAALIEAAIRIDQERFVGRKTSTTQARKFPRYEIYDDEDILYASDEIPTPVKNAQCELALMLLENNDLFAESELSQFNRIVVGRGELDITPRHGSTGRLPNVVSRFLRSMIVTGGQVIRC